MKTNTIKIILVLAAMSLLTACGGSGSSSKRVSRGDQNIRNNGNNPVTTVNYSQADYQGIIYSDYGYNTDFQTAVQGLLSPLGNPQDFVGFVDASSNSGDVTFSANIQANQQFDPQGNNYINSSATGSLSLVIFDDYSKSDPNQYPPINIVADRQTYVYVDGNNAEVEFEWEFGIITFKGYIDSYSETFMGTVTFQNFSHYDGGNGGSGTLGSFQVSACNFFQCRY